MDASHPRQTRSFVLRLWIEPTAEPTQWRGQLECVGDGEKIYFSSSEGLIHAVARWVPNFNRMSPPKE